LAATITQARSDDTQEPALKELICALVTAGANGHALSANDKDYLKSVLYES